MPLRRTYRVHFVGIGGIGMSGIAEVLLNLGYQISGSDLVESETTLRLENLGARVCTGHRLENLGEADVVVVSGAVAEDNPEVLAARERGIPVIQRAEMLAELMRMKHAVAVAGSHGKTTTTSMLGSILAEAGLDPTLVVGGRLNSLGSNARLGQGEFLVAEADESDGSFLKLTPTFAVVTNIDPEHLDHHGTFEALVDAFAEFANKVPFYGQAVLCLDHPSVQGLLPRVHKRVATYGIASQADFRAEELRFEPGAVRFQVRRRGEALGEVRLHMLGEHNVLNALACVAVADELRVPFEVVRRALEQFQGVQRRFSVKGTQRGVTVVDDYGHHPEEIKATLQGARRSYSNRLVVVFQPHRYTRTQLLEREFYSAFNLADVLVVMDVYPAGEPPIPGVSGQALFEGIRRHGHHNAHFISDRKLVVDWLLEHTRADDYLITMGAGDVWRVGDDFLARAQAGEGRTA
ncbi:MAG TPA: UDP-N-acetylmuramate--L-alanine ligase [Myxococcota bacterium]|nr:UDP-N-acetylmuramate--L-alanine ligase [Myxococcota bacterium]HRY91905.1 UDP-N-acetylmuramate--L-alanine ligase [Myxococcota bacterium]HSA22720.1 UDP-N-acetylmuramate--L-alanine ligase [Myxococcota bacterium]